MTESQTQLVVYDLLNNKDDVSWKDVLLDLVKTNQMDPWDIDVSQLSHQYILKVKELKEMDFRLSGKMVLAAALLIKLKSQRLVGSDLMNFDRMLSDSQEEYYDDDVMDDESYVRPTNAPHEMILYPKTPQPRTRKVSIYDLVDALQKALEVKKRRLIRPKAVYNTIHEAPAKKVDISKLITEMFTQIKNYYGAATKGSKLLFSSLVPTDGSKEDKVLTFMPVLYLTNQGRVDLEQDEHFGEIDVIMTNDAPLDDIAPDAF